MLKQLFPPLLHLNAANVVTTASVALTVVGIRACLLGMPAVAVTCLMLATGCDVLDGAVARRLNQQSAFGGGLDSLADALGFCVLPSVIALRLGLDAMPDVLVLVAYTSAGVWRLAHFA